MMTLYVIPRTKKGHQLFVSGRGAYKQTRTAYHYGLVLVQPPLQHSLLPSALLVPHPHTHHWFMGAPTDASLRTTCWRRLRGAIDLNVCAVFCIWRKLEDVVRCEEFGRRGSLVWGAGGFGSGFVIRHLTNTRLAEN